jgi:hypothetical protein
VFFEDCLIIHLHVSSGVLKLQGSLNVRAVGIVLAALPCGLTAWQPGTYPAAPARMASSGFAVDSQNRNDVVAFWHAVYQASEGYEKRIGWTGNYTGKIGTTSDDFLDDVERRVNYFRAMCGVPANARINTDSTVVIDSADTHKPSAGTLKSTAAQTAALMLIRNYNSTTGDIPAMNHNPPESVVGWSEAAWNASAKGNLAFGIFGPGAISEYVVEELSAGSTTSAWNSLVGHRRWIVFPEATNFATGDQPGTSVHRPPSNVFYVAQNPGELVPDPTPGFVAYPSPGFFPAPVNSRYWSLSRAGADFSTAAIRVTDAAGTPVPITNVQRNSTFGDPAIIWQVTGGAAARNVFSDTLFNVSVTGISGAGIPSSFNYSVTLINPDRLTSNQAISGSKTPVSNKTTPYSFTPPANAEGLAVTAFLRKSSTWKEGAEKSPKPQVIDRTASNYSLKAKMSGFGAFGGFPGKYAFRLTFPVSYDLQARGVPEQSFELKRLIIPKAGAKLTFLYRRGYMSKGSNLVVETSNNGGVTWKTAGKAIKGASDTKYDSQISTAAIALPKSSQPLRVRFRYFTKPGAAIYTHEAAPSSPTGIFIDDITTRNCDWLDPAKTTYLAANASQFSFNTSSAGGSLIDGSRWSLGLQTKLGGKWFPHGPLTTVTIKAP